MKKREFCDFKGEIWRIFYRKAEKCRKLWLEERKKRNSWFYRRKWAKTNYQRERSSILNEKNKLSKREISKLFRYLEWYFASVWIDLSSSRNRHVSSIRLWFSSLVTNGHSNIVSFYNNLLLSKRSLFYSWGWGWMFNDFNIDYRENRNEIIDLWSSSSSSRILCCSPRVYSTIEKWNVKQLERKTIFRFCAFRNLLSTLDDRFSWLRTRI